MVLISAGPSPVREISRENTAGAITLSARTPIAALERHVQHPWGAWWSYAFQRWGGIEFGAAGPYGRTPKVSRPGEIVLTSQDDRRDRRRFAEAYGDPESGVSMGPRPSTGPVCVGPLT
jgi:hypothetical protein